MTITLTTPDQQPDNTQVRLIRFAATILPDRRIIADYAYGRVVNSKFVADLEKQFRKIFDDTTTPSFADFINNVPAAVNLRNQTETYIKALDSISGTVD